MTVIFNPKTDDAISLKMIAYTEAHFKTGIDPTQIPVSKESRKKLNALSPYCLCVEVNDKREPISWRVSIPTTKELAYDFLEGKITEKEMFDRTPVGIAHNALYLASSSTIPEYRRQGLAKKLLKLSIEKFKATEPIELIFAWPYSKEGSGLLTSVSKELNQEIRLKG